MSFLPHEPSIQRVKPIAWGDMDDDTSLPEITSMDKEISHPSILSEEAMTPNDVHTSKNITSTSTSTPRIQLDFRAMVSSWQQQPNPCLSPSIITNTPTTPSTPSSMISTTTSITTNISHSDTISPIDPVCKVLNFESHALPTIQEFDAELDSSRDGLPLLFKGTGLSTTTTQQIPTLTRTTTPISVWGSVQQPRIPLSTIQQQEALATTTPPTTTTTRKRRHTPLKNTATVITPSKQSISTRVVDKKQQDKEMIPAATAVAHGTVGWTPNRSKQLINIISGSPRADAVSHPDSVTPQNSKKQKRSTTPAPAHALSTSVSPITVPSTPSTIQDVISLPTTPTIMSTTTSPSTSVVASPISCISVPTSDKIEPLMLSSEADKTATTTTSTETTTETKDPSTPTTDADRIKGSAPRTLTRRERLMQRQKQIDLGKKTQGYQQYTQIVQKRDRTSAHPKTPNIHKICSKRSWDGQVRQWRRLLHTFDPQPNNKQEHEDDDVDLLNSSMESEGSGVHVDGEIEGENEPGQENQDEWTLVDKVEEPPATQTVVTL